MKKTVYKKLLNLIYKCMNAIRINIIILFAGVFGFLAVGNISAAQLKAGVAKVNITNKETRGPVSDSLYVKALVLDNGNTKAVLISVDAIAIGRIGSIGDDYRKRLRVTLT